LFLQLLFNELNLKIKIRTGVVESSRAIENNGLRLKEVGAFEEQTFF
jgi:hypothetical protein